MRNIRFVVAQFSGALTEEGDDKSIKRKIVLRGTRSKTIIANGRAYNTYRLTKRRVEHNCANLNISSFENAFVTIRSLGLVSLLQLSAN